MRKWVPVLTLAGLLVLLMLGGATGAGKVQKVTVTLREMSFTPSRVTLQAGVEAEMKLINQGKIRHEFMVYKTPSGKIADWDEYVMPNTYFKDIGEVKGEFAGIGYVAGTSIFEIEVDAGKSATIAFTPNKKGTFEMACHIEGHYEGGMKGVLVVK